MKRIMKTVASTVMLAVVAGVLAAGAASAAAVAASCDPNAPDSARVDLAQPVFSNPTQITNPLFPMSSLKQVIQLGEEAGEKLRNEITLLPQTRIVDYKGQKVRTLVSQFVAYKDGRLVEVAVDLFAQDNAGSVWYFGESVDNYENGVIANHNGTWLAGKDGPAGMIMPAHPNAGDVYRPENIPGLVFETVTVKQVNVTVDGPRGPVPGAIAVEECLADGSLENKIFAPSYGEFQARAGDELATVALAVPTDSLKGAMPRELATLSEGAVEVFNDAESEDWADVDGTLGEMNRAWATYQTRAVPRLLKMQTTDSLQALNAAAGARQADEARQLAIDVGRAGLDLQLRYRSPASVDRDRIALWQLQSRLDKQAGDSAEIAGDKAAISAIRRRS